MISRFSNGHCVQRTRTEVTIVAAISLIWETWKTFGEPPERGGRFPPTLIRPISALAGNLA